MEEKITQLMSALDITRAEAIDLIASDKETDRMSMAQINAELTTEQKKAIKSMTKADRKPTVFKFDKKERKADTKKSDIISLLIAGLGDSAQDLVVENAERTFTFMYDGRKYKVVLSAPRS